MIPRLEPPICGTRFFTSLLVSKGYLAMAHEPRAIMRMAEHLELVDPVDMLEALAEADTKRQYTHGLAEAINAEGGWGHWENIDMVLLYGIAKPKERLDGWQSASLFRKIQCSFAASADCD